MKLLTYGDGLVQTQQGVTDDSDKLRCLVLSERASVAAVGAIPTEWDEMKPENEIAVMLAFKTLASARTLQDELNELIAIWAKEVAPKHEGR